MFAKATCLKHFLLFTVLSSLSLSQASSNWLTCYAQPNGVVLPVAQDCNVYIYCLDQTPFTIVCPLGMGYSVLTGGCVDYSQSDCIDDDVTTTAAAAHYQHRGICDNEKRLENKEACRKQPFGELVPYPGDCSKFLVCNCEYPTVKQCPGGTWFDNTIKTCNYPQNVNCVDGNGGSSTIITTEKTTTHVITTTTSGSGEWGEDCKAPAGMEADICLEYNNGLLLRYPYNCNAYINCTMGCPIMKYCPADKVFNNLLKICDTPDTAQCVELTLPTTTEEPLTTTQETTPATEVTTTKIVTTTETGGWGEDCTAPAGMQAGICLEYNNGLLLRYPYNCNAYINCTMGCPVMNHCQPDKVFNNLLKICDTPDTAQCVELPLQTSTTEQPYTSTQETTTELITTTNTPEQCIPALHVDKHICSNEYQGSYLPYAYNCTAYVVCRNEEEPCLHYCENGKIFNSLLGICDDDIECQELPLPTTTLEPETTTAIASTLPPNVNPSLCQGKEDYTIYPYEADCSQYLECKNQQVIIENCPQGWLFNSKLMLCDEASEDVCYNAANSTTEEPNTTTSEPVNDVCIGKTLGTTFPYKENCALYYYCRGNGEFYLLPCPYNNYYDPYSGNCGPDVASNACLKPITTTAATTTETTTLSPAQKCANESAGTTYPYEENCAKYIYCKGNGGFAIFNCPYNNYYYPLTRDCGPSDDVDICRQPIQTTTTITISTSTAPSPATTQTPTPKPILGICGNYSNGQLINYPDKCQKYISCVKPIPIAFYCNNNWYFHEQQQQCVADSEGTCTGLPANVTTTAATPSGICQGLKQGDTEIYSSNCQLYYECLADGYYMLKTCTEAEYFNPLTGECSAQVGAHYCKQNFDTTLAPSTSTAAPPKPQGICAEQPDGWKVPYPHNCSKYIECAKPINIGFSCLDGLEFSSEAQQCVEPSASDCALITKPTATTTPYNQCSNEPDFTLLPYEQNCAMFIICVKQQEHLAYCKAGEYFDFTAAKCLASANEESCISGHTTEAITITTTDPNLGPCYNKPEGSKIPYPNNCTKYIVCKYPLNVGYDCPDALEFSAHYEQCVEPALADCSIKTTPTRPTTTEITTTTTTQASETCDNKPTGSTLPYPQDCSKYYMCINGQQQLTSCMPNSYYDPATEDCDNDISPTACQASTTAATSTQSSVTNTTISQPPQGVCTDATKGFTYANVQDCTEYYMCLDSSAVLCKCQTETYYNPYTRECDGQTSNTECKQPITIGPTEATTTIITSEITTAITEPADGNICCGQKSGTYLPYPGDNTKYVICQYPLPQVHSCPKGSTYDALSLSCKLLATFGILKPKCTPNNYSEKTVYSGDCTKYYFCFGSEAVILDCSFDWNYNPAIEQCVPKVQYKCPW